MHRILGSLIPLFAFTLAACSGAPEDDELPPYSPPLAACSEASASGVPVVALEWRGARETYLPAGSTALALDYDVVPRAHVDRVLFTYDFDPEQPTPAPYELSTECPLSVSLADLLVPIEADDVVSMSVTASSSSGGAERRGRVFVPRGGAPRMVDLTGLDLGDPNDGDWYLLFEPAAGAPRLVITPAGEGGTATLEGVPDAPGTFALIQAPALRVDEASGAIHAPGGFARSWRRQARAWYASTVLFSDEPVLLGAVVLPGTSVPYRSASAAEVLTEAEPALLLEGAPSGVTTDLEVPCTAVSLLLRGTGFVSAEVTTSSAVLRMGAGGRLAIPIECEPGATSAHFPLQITSLGGIPAPIFAALGGLS